MAQLFHINSVLITGANRGLGLKLVEVLLNADSPPKHIFACYRDAAKAADLQEIASKHSQLKLVEMDIANEVGIKSALNAVDSVVSNEGLDVLINNAGILDKSSIYEVTSELMEKSLRVNAVGPLMIVQAFLPLLEKSKNGPINSVIVNISSINGSLTSTLKIPDRYPYKCSKAALNMITRLLGRDLESKQIASVAIHPGWMATDMGGSNAPVSPLESATSIVDFVRNITMDKSGKFYDLHGDVLAW